ncbi:MAG: shikimate kinase [Chlorobi bacterium]|nr:shikimate kinase [Chlorobiota bacterium]
MAVKIALSGYMGSGKSSVGRALAALTGFAFTDLDEEVAKKTGLSPAELIRQKGEEAFRATEEKVLKEILQSEQDMILALGGGTVTHPGSRRVLKDQAIVVFLHTPPEMIVRRLETEEGDRPLLPKNGRGTIDREAIRRHYASRLPYYRQADVVFQNEYDDPQTAAEFLFQELKRQGYV